MAGVKHDQSKPRRLSEGLAMLQCRPVVENDMNWRLFAALTAALLVSGCVGSVVKAVVTAPIKAAGAVVDATTTSQEEADRNRGREIRKQEEREAKERKGDAPPPDPQRDRMSANEQ